MNSSYQSGQQQQASASPTTTNLGFNSYMTTTATSDCSNTFTTSTVNNNIKMDSFSNTDQLIDPNMEPQIRNRCNTWPRRPIIEPPSNHDTESTPSEQIIKEEEEPDDFKTDLQLDDDFESQSHNLSGGQDHLNISNQLGINNSSELGSQGDLNAKKQSARKNAWGNLSYADLITKAIQSSPEKRLTLSQIYDWMVQNVGYFRDKGDSNSSAGWKNSIRHNLSLHNRFMRIQNEGAGKSSWWVINPDAKPGKAPRRPRGGSMDSKSMSMKAKRDQAMKKVRELKNKGLLNKDGLNSPVSPGNEFTLSPGDDRYRDRASSFASSISGRRSPIMHDDLLVDSKVSPWGSETHLDSYDFPNMEGCKLPEDLEQILKFPDMHAGSFKAELDSISEPSYMDSTPSGMTDIYKPYSSYLSEGAPSSYNPPPPYPAEQQNQYNKQTNGPSTTLFKDPMMTGYNPNNGNNNSLSPSLPQRQYAGGFTNGGISSQIISTSGSQNTRLSQGQMTQAQQPRVLPTTLQAALLGNNPRANQISQSLKQSSPILTQQLLECNPPQNQQHQQQSMFNNTTPQQQQQQVMGQPRQQQPMSYGQYPNQQQQDQTQQGYGMYNTAPNQMTYFPSDLDLDNMPELLSCDVDQVIQNELQMDGGQLDFDGFEGYSTHQQQQQAANSQSGQGNLGIGLS